MKMRNIYLLMCLIFTLTVNAQKPFEELGLDDEIELLTLSDGRYVEHFANDTLRQIGSVIFNTVTNKVEYFIADEELEKMNVANRNREVSRFLSTDPVMQPHQSPYLYAANNPIIYIDKDGEDNVIYLVAIPGKKSKLNKLDVHKIAEKANSMYEGMGLNTRVVVYESKDPFDPANIDPSDSYALIGSVSDIKKAVNNDKYPTNIKYRADVIGGGVGNPEESVIKGKGIIISADGVVNGYDKELKTDANSAAAFLILHGSGHNALYTHSVHGAQSDEAIMSDAPQAYVNQGQEYQSNGKSITIIGNLINSLEKIVSMSNTTQFQEAIKSSFFGTNKSQDNYVNNKRRNSGERPVNAGQK